MTLVTKFCSSCRTTLSVEKFFRQTQSKDGFARWCKKCQALNKRNRLANNPRSREKQRISRIKYRKAKLEYIKEYHKEYRANNPEKIRARNAISILVRSGKIPRAKDCRCAACGKPAAEYHHYRGYAWEHRHNVVPVCRTCHGHSHAQYQQ